MLTMRRLLPTKLAMFCRCFAAYDELFQPDGTEQMRHVDQKTYDIMQSLRREIIENEWVAVATMNWFTHQSKARARLKEKQNAV